MPTERELLALCLRWIQHPQGDAFDKAMLIEAIKAKLKPEREWVGLTEEEMAELWENRGWYVTIFKAVEAKLKEKNDR